MFLIVLWSVVTFSGESVNLRTGALSLINTFQKLIDFPVCTCFMELLAPTINKSATPLNISLTLEKAFANFGKYIPHQPQPPSSRKVRVRKYYNFNSLKTL
jgi:hypothetical protein